MTSITRDSPYFVLVLLNVTLRGEGIAIGHARSSDCYPNTSDSIPLPLFDELDMENVGSLGLRVPCTIRHSHIVDGIAFVELLPHH